MIKQFSENGLVGVLKPCCTTRYVRIRASAISRRTSSWLEEQGQRPAMQRAGRYGIWGLRAPARCSTVPAGTNAASKGSRLKLTVVRRTWAGHVELRPRWTFIIETILNQTSVKFSLKFTNPGAKTPNPS